MTRRFLESVLVVCCLGLVSCGPEPGTTRDIEPIKATYCEMAAGCIEDPDFDVAFCMQRLHDLGIYEGGWYDENGCLDLEADFLECLSGVTCEEYVGVDFTEPGGACNAEAQTMIEAGCPPGTG